MKNGLLFLACVAIWGSTWYAITFQLGAVPEEWSVAYRFALAAFLLLAYCRLTGRTLRFPRRDHVVFAALGALLFSFNYALVYWGTNFLPSGLVAVAFSMMSVVNIANGAFFLGQRIEARVLLGALVGVSGLVLVFLPEFASLEADAEALKGVAICLGATVVASFGNTLAATERAKAYPLLAFNGYAMLYGALWMAATALVLGKAPAFDWGADYLLSLGYLSLIGTIAAFTIYLTLLKTLGIGRAAYVAVAIPVVALAISTLLEGYRWTAPAGIGVLLVIGGNLLVTRFKRPKRPY